MCSTGDTRRIVWKKIRNGTQKGGTTGQSLRMMNVSYAGTSNIIYVKQQQQDNQMRPSIIKTRIKYSLLIQLVKRKQCGCKVCREATKIPTGRIRDQRKTTRVQFNGNPNSYWLLRWRHETSGKPDLTTDITLEKNKSDIKRNGGGSTI